MVVDFNDWLGLPKLLYEIAERYEGEGQYEQAKGSVLYRFVLPAGMGGTVRMS